MATRFFLINHIIYTVMPDLSRSAHRLPNGSLFESSTKSSGPNFRQDSLWESAGIQSQQEREKHWIPASAGMTLFAIINVLVYFSVIFMHSRLIEILEEKKQEVARLKKKGIASPVQRNIPRIRDFKSAISQPDRINLIAEIKFASPSAGTIREKTDPVKIGRIYERAGAAAISLLTDQKYFHGHLENLSEVKQAVSLPVLRKDFIIDEIQIREALVWGADAILLIVRILSEAQLKELLDVCHENGLAVLVEIHDRKDLEKALNSKAEIIGINNRDLDTFEINLQTTHDLAALIPKGHIIVGESGIHNQKDIKGLKGSKVNAVLVGSSLMSSDDMESKTREMVEAGR